jgi:hypothetical protein
MYVDFEQIPFIPQIADKLQNLDVSFIDLQNLSSEKIFTFVTIFIAIIYAFSWFTMNLSYIVGAVVGVVIIYYLFLKHQKTEVDYIRDMKLKIQSITPTPKYFNQYDEIVDFFYSIREYSHYHYFAYEKAVKSIDHFFKIYWYVFNEPMLSNCMHHVQLAEEKINDALNHLRSVEFKQVVNDDIKDKLHLAVNHLHIMMNKYLLKMIHKCNSINDSLNDITKDVEIIPSAPKPVNHFNHSNMNDKNPYSFDV